MEGFRLVTEALNSSERVIQILATRENMKSQRWTDLNPLIERNIVNMVAITAVQADQLSETRSPQGIFALMPLPGYDEIPPLKGPLLILDNLSDPGNVGTIIRTAAWFGIEAILASSETVDFYNSKVLRSAMGGHLRIGRLWQGEPEQIHQAVKEANLLLVGATMAGEPIGGQRVDAQNWAVVLGSEAHGLTRFWSERLVKAISIRGAGGAESLNVAVAAGIIMEYLSKAVPE